MAALAIRVSATRVHKSREFSYMRTTGISSYYLRLQDSWFSAVKRAISADFSRFFSSEAATLAAKQRLLRTRLGTRLRLWSKLLIGSCYHRTGRRLAQVSNFLIESVYKNDLDLEARSRSTEPGAMRNGKYTQSNQGTLVSELSTEKLHSTSVRKFLVQKNKVFL